MSESAELQALLACTECFERKEMEEGDKAGTVRVSEAEKIEREARRKGV